MQEQNYPYITKVFLNFQWQHRQAFHFLTAHQKSFNHSLTLIPSPIKPGQMPHPSSLGLLTEHLQARSLGQYYRPSPRLFYHVEHTKNMDIYTTAQPTVVLSFFNWVRFLFNGIFLISFFRSHIAKNNQPKKSNPTIPCQFPGPLLHKIFSHVSVISFLTVLRANSKEFSLPWDSSSSTGSIVGPNQTLGLEWNLGQYHRIYPKAKDNQVPQEIRASGRARAPWQKLLQPPWDLQVFMKEQHHWSMMHILWLKENTSSTTLKTGVIAFRPQLIWHLAEMRQIRP